MIKVNPLERAERARGYFRQGYNCSQSVVLAYSDVIGQDETTVAQFAAGFGGGMGRMRQVCGSFSGMVMVSGFLKPFTNPSVAADKGANYELIQHFASQFKAETGSIVCGELLGLAKGENNAPQPSPRNKDYYQRRPCVEYVALAARLLGDYINSQE